MEASRGNTDHYVVRIHLPAPSTRSDGKDHKHTPTTASPRPASRPDRPHDEPPARSLTSRAVRWLCGEPVVVGTVPHRECKGGITSWRSWSRHVVPVMSALISDIGVAVIAKDTERPLAFTLGTASGLAYGYTAEYFTPSIADSCAWLRERCRLRAGSVSPPQQLERIVALTNAQALTRDGLSSAIDKLEALHRLYPDQVAAGEVADGIARLAGGAMDVGPDTVVHLVTLTGALKAWHARGAIDGSTLARAFTRLANELCNRQPAVMPDDKLTVLRFLIGILVDWADGGPGRLSEADRVAWLKDTVTVGGLEGPDADTLKQHAWAGLIRGLPEAAGPQFDAILARLALARPDPEWMLTYALAHAEMRHQPENGGEGYAAYARCVMRLLAAFGGDYTRARINSWTQHTLWGENVRNVEGVAEQLVGLLPELVDAFGWRLTRHHVSGIMLALVSTNLFDPEPELALHQVAMLVRPTMSMALRAYLASIVVTTWGRDALQSLASAFTPDAIRALLRDQPAHLLDDDIPIAVTTFQRGCLPLQAARQCLAVMDVLVQRPAEPGFPRLDAGLLSPAVVTGLIDAIAAAAPDEGNRDRGELIARLPQLCQRAATPGLVERAVRAILSLPELQADRDTHPLARKYPSETLALVLQACTSPTLFISRSDEWAQAQADAQQPQASDFLTPDADQPAGQGPARLAESAAIEHAWLTPAFIAQMTAPLTGQRESKHG